MMQNKNLRADTLQLFGSNYKNLFFLIQEQLRFKDNFILCVIIFCFNFFFITKSNNASCRLSSFFFFSKISANACAQIFAALKK
jgi:hypothetical protein